MTTSENDTWTFFEGAWHPGNVRIMGPRSHGAWLGSTVFDRVDLGGEVPRLRRVPAHDVDARPAPPPARQLSRPPEASR